ncbi:MAG: hypothetical protein K5669_07355 [Lachnospiraceae bacterium]|nr:hypothetical protein [Lachnospiraceae bacterium]
MATLLYNNASFADIWPISSTWNDEAFYYKQTQGIVDYGIPQGYFGYNESRAQQLTFGAWAPVILYPCAVFGKIFGFGFNAPYIFNIIFLSAALLVFGLLSHIKLKEASILYILLFAFFPISRFTLSYMPEIMMIGLVILLYGLFLSSVKKLLPIKDILIYLILTYLVIMRPYLATLFVFPLYLAFKRTGKKKLFYAVACVLIALISLVLYSKINDKFTAPYIGDVYIDYFSKVFTHGPRTVFNEVVQSLDSNMRLMLFRIGKAFNGLDSVGGYYLCFIISSLLVATLGILGFIGKAFKGIASKNKKNNSPVTYDSKAVSPLLYLLVFVAQLSVLLAVLILYNVADGYRHLVVFIVLDIFIMCMDKHISAYVKLPLQAVCAAAFILFFLVKADIPDYKLPVIKNSSPEREQFYSHAKEINEILSLTDEISWDNTVDVLPSSSENLECYYLVPSGFGINLCEESYLESNINNLKSKYIILPADNTLCSKLIDIGYTKEYAAGSDYILLSH